ncbi:MAG: endo-1,4-beta-xylanase [Candidatus Hinthialibacter antarcticus]|nr:endo-1,4-beta-xylanase [Candidatus Hinthialibacter antarcticus]
MKRNAFFLLLITFSLMNSNGETLRELAETRGIYIGSASNLRLQTDKQYADVLGREFSMMTPENDFKFHKTHPENGRYTFESGDAYIQFAEKHNMQVRGHALLWHQATPKWVTEAEWTRESLLDLMREHIQTVAGRYSGKLYAWDVVNEYFEQDGSVRKSVWSETIGADYMEIAHRTAREFDPTARLIVNDFDIAKINKKSDALYEWVKDAKQRGVPVDGVGFQMHVPFNYDFDEVEFLANLQRFADLGLEIHITELDVRIKEPVTPEKLQQQATLYGDILRACLKQPACKVFVMWGFTDRSSWIPRFFTGFNDALIFDREYKPKPAYHTLKSVFANKN